MCIIEAQGVVSATYMFFIVVAHKKLTIVCPVWFELQYQNLRFRALLMDGYIIKGI